MQSCGLKIPIVVQEKRKNSEIMHPDKLQKIKKECLFFPVTEDTKRSIYFKMQTTFNLETNLKTCAFCDVLKKEDDFVYERPRNVFNRCRSRLVLYPGIPSSLVNSFDVSDFIPELKMSYFQGEV